MTKKFIVDVDETGHLVSAPVEYSATSTVTVQTPVFVPQPYSTYLVTGLISGLIIGVFTVFIIKYLTKNK